MLTIFNVTVEEQVDLFFTQRLLKPLEPVYFNFINFLEVVDQTGSNFFKEFHVHSIVMAKNTSSK